MDRISTNATLFLKLFLPIFWVVFFGCVVLTVWFVPTVSWGVLSETGAKIALTLLYMFFILFLYRTLFRLKRIELDDLFVYVYSYFKSVRYPYHMIESIHENSLGPLRLTRIRLKMDGTFGRSIYFLESPERVKRQREEKPQFNELFD